MLASDIITSARYTLSDTSNARWSNERLLVLLNEGLSDIAKRTTLFTNTLYMGISNLVGDYDLSTYVTKIHRVEYLDVPLPMHSFDEMDTKYGDTWQTDTGEKPLAIVIDLQNQGQFKLYPLVENLENSHIIFTQTFGIITAVGYSDIEPLVEYDFGDLGSLEDTGYLKIYYTRKHAEVTEVTTTLEVNSLAREPLAHYVAGRALRDNIDIQNRTVGGEELDMYKSAIEAYSGEKSKNFSTSTNKVHYNPLGN